jgi:catechol 2,3-dioxygenase
MAVMRLGYAHVRVTDLAEAKDHYANTMGLYETLSEGNKVYYKAWDEWDHHSVVLEEGGVGLVKYGWKVQYSSDIDEIEKKAQTFGVTVERMSKGENPEIGDGIRFTTPSDHVFEVYHEATLIGTEVGTHNPDAFPRHLVGVGVPALDHSLITAEDPGMMDRFLTDVFGFYATERVQTSLDDDADIIATWMTNSTRSTSSPCSPARRASCTTSPSASATGPRSAAPRTCSPWTTCRSTSARPVTASPVARPFYFFDPRATATRCSPAATWPTRTAR